jgi:hypothetical protein
MSSLDEASEIPTLEVTFRGRNFVIKNSDVTARSPKRIEHKCWATEMDRIKHSGGEPGMWTSTDMKTYTSSMTIQGKLSNGEDTRFTWSTELSASLPSLLPKYVELGLDEDGYIVGKIKKMGAGGMEYGLMCLNEDVQVVGDNDAVGNSPTKKSKCFIM